MEYENEEYIDGLINESGLYSQKELRELWFLGERKEKYATNKKENVRFRGPRYEEDL